MPNFLINLAAFVLAISFLVAFHEYGHYCVARRLGVKVLRFSIGFGPIIWRKVLKNGVEFCISAIPMGGYVKMLDEREGPVPADQVHLAFNRQSPWKRIAIVIAGPLTNFLLAFLLFIIVMMSGIDGIAPIVIDVKPDSPASHAGIHHDDEIIAVEGQKTETIMQVSRAFAKDLDKPTVSLTLEHHHKPYTVLLPMPSLLDSNEKDLFDNMGLVMGLPARVGKLQPGSPAESVGLKHGDRIVSINDESILDWMKVVDFVSVHPGEKLKLGVRRAGTLETIEIIPETKANGKGYLGVYLDESLLRKEKLGFLSAVTASFKQTYQYSWLTLKMIYLMITGQASLEHLSGPVSIAQVAGATAKVGFTYYIDFLAIISISLGVLNLLPVPMLDGGHLLYYFIEVVRGKPLSEAAQMMGLRIGLIILVSLMFVAFYNDILRLV